MSNPAESRTLRMAVAVVIVFFGIWAGMRVRSGKTLPAQAAIVRVPVGEASPPSRRDIDSDIDPSDPAIPPPAKIPERLPEFSLSDPAGKTISSTAWEGKSLILNFWATWCAPCRREIPLLETLHGAWAARNVQVVGIAVDHRDQVLAYAHQLKISYPLLLGEQDALDVAAKLGVESPVFPFTVFTDRRGDIVTLYVGELHAAEADLILAAVQNLNDNRVEMAEARRTIAAGLQALGRNRPG